MQLLVNCFVFKSIRISVKCLVAGYFVLPNQPAVFPVQKVALKLLDHTGKLSVFAMLTGTALIKTTLKLKLIVLLIEEL